MIFFCKSAVFFGLSQTSQIRTGENEITLLSHVVSQLPPQSAGERLGFRLGRELAYPSSLTNELALQGHFDPDSYSRSGVKESEVAVPADMIAIAILFVSPVTRLLASLTKAT
jgi:hypothetical protein